MPGSAQVMANMSDGSASFLKDVNLGGGLAFDKGILLTSGDGTPPTANTETAYSRTASGQGDPLLDPIVASTGQSTTDGTRLEFLFKLDPDFNGIELKFAFGTEEFPDQGVVDVAGIFVNGINYAQFPSGQPLSFILNSPTAAQFNNNDNGQYNIEYDGLTNLFTLRAPVEFPGLSNSLIISIADTADTIYDSGIFVTGLRGISLGSPGGASGASPTDPLLPLENDDPGDGFDFPLIIGDTGLGISQPLFIDPPVAIGYKYTSFGANFATVLVPGALPGGDGEFLIDLGISGMFDLFAGISFDILAIVPEGVSEFSILDIDAGEMLDPSNPVAFVTGLTFVHGGQFEVNMTAITANVDEPSGIAILSLTLPLLLLRGRRQREL